MDVTSFRYSIDLDHDVWIPVPLGFPWQGFTSVEGWSDALTSDLLETFGAAPDVVSAFRESARIVASVPPPLPGALERFWHVPVAGGPDRVAHLYIAQTEATTAEQLAHLARAGVGGIVQSATVLEQTGFDVAMHAIVLAHADETDIVVDRMLGLRYGHVVVLESIDRDVRARELVAPHLEQLFRSIAVTV